MILLVITISCLSLLFAVYLARYVLQHEMGTEKMQEISNAIKEGAEAFLSRQNRTIILFSSCASGSDFLALCFCPDAKSGRSRAPGANGFLDYVLLCTGRVVLSHRRLRRHVGVDPRQYSNGGGGSIELERGAEDRDAGWRGVRALRRCDEPVGCRRPLLPA